LDSLNRIIEAEILPCFYKEEGRNEILPCSLEQGTKKKFLLMGFSPISLS
jgi:hypothetical protein